MLNNVVVAPVTSTIRSIPTCTPVGPTEGIDHDSVAAFDNLAAVRKVTDTDLPGVGVRFDLETIAGRFVGVVAHQTGRRDLVIYDERDIDRVFGSVELTEDEGHTLGEFLGGQPDAGASGRRRAPPGGHRDLMGHDRLHVGSRRADPREGRAAHGNRRRRRRNSSRSARRSASS